MTPDAGNCRKVGFFPLLASDCHTAYHSGPCHHGIEPHFQAGKTSKMLALLLMGHDPANTSDIGH